VAEDSFEQIKLFLPKYLTPDKQAKLFEELKQFPENKNFYQSPAPPAELLQGDGWRGLVVIDFDSLEKKPISGVILSNSCDIDIHNPRATEMNILFAPIIRLEKYRLVLAAGGISQAQIESTLSTIRKQRVSYIFYLPELRGVIEESMILLDDVHAQPLRSFLANSERSRLFVLSQYGFYILLFKLSIHFSRFQEDIDRAATAPTS
jgi:hypothetical protein